MFDALEKRLGKDGHKQPELINELYQGDMKDYVKCLEVCDIFILSMDKLCIVLSSATMRVLVKTIFWTFHWSSNPLVPLRHMAVW